MFIDLIARASEVVTTVCYRCMWLNPCDVYNPGIVACLRRRQTGLAVYLLASEKLTRSTICNRTKQLSTPLASNYIDMSAFVVPNTKTQCCHIQSVRKVDRGVGGAGFVV